MSVSTCGGFEVAVKIPFMAFKVNQNGLNHSPDWYEARCRSENAPVSIETMLKNDMKFIGADYDSAVTTVERIPTYRERWNAILGGETLVGHGKAMMDARLQAEIVRIMEKENKDILSPTREFESEPFTSIDKIMCEAGLSEGAVRKFLTWRTRRRSKAALNEKTSELNRGPLHKDNEFFG